VVRRLQGRSLELTNRATLTVDNDFNAFDLPGAWGCRSAPGSVACQATHEHQDLWSPRAEYLCWIPSLQRLQPRILSYVHAVRDFLQPMLVSVTLPWYTFDTAKPEDLRYNSGCRIDYQSQDLQPVRPEAFSSVTESSLRGCSGASARRARGADP
jgi:hypothetical protein